MSKTEKKLGIVSLILVAVLVLTAVFNVAYVGNIATAVNGNGATSSIANNFVKSDMNFDSVREQYFNKELVQKNIASFDGDRGVIVALEGDTLYEKYQSSTRYNDFASYSASVEGQKVQKSLKIAQSEFLGKLDRHGIDYQYKYSYTAINNAVAIKVNAEAYNAIKKMSGVEDVFYAEYYDVPKVAAVENNANVYTTGIYNSKDLDYKGEGMVVAILDTGLDRTHEAFQTMPKDGGAWDKEYIEGIVDDGRLMAEGTADDFYYTQKVPFAYDYADDDANVFPSYSSHGTHVAGIVAGSSDYVVNQETGETFVGVAPEAQLAICKVFTDNLDSDSLGGANTMSILAALNDCVQLGVDVINMSLGSSAGFTDEKSDKYINDIYQMIEDAGISLVVAASNDYSSGFGGGNGTNLASNPDSGTVGSPSTYHSALSVASINGQKSSYIMADAKTGNEDDNPVAFIYNSSNEFGQEFEFIDQLYEIASKNRGTTVQKGEKLTFKYVVVGGIGASNNYNATVLRQLSQKDGYDGTIALIKRGTNTFAEKIQAAMATDADAAIIYNNVSGTIKMSLGDIDDPIPACSISMDAGKQFVDLAGRTAVGKVIVNSDYQAGPFMSEFSSWGPTPDLQLKPEITAHGGEITSAVAGGYDKYSGTSMASPNMAGAVAILRQYLGGKYNLTGKELNARVNQVLMSTATIARNEEGNPYSPRKQGAGLAGIADAIKSESYITVLVNGDVSDKTKIELYDDPDKVGEYVLNFTIHNVTDKVQTYNPLTHVMTETMSSDNKTVAEKAYMLSSMCDITYETGADANNLTANSGTINVQPNSSLAVRVTVKLGSQARKYLDSNFVNGMYVEGFVSLQATGQTTVNIGLPYLAFYGDWTDAPLFDYDEYEIAEDDKDTSKEESEKIKASAAATTPIGMYHNDEYYMPLGTYLYAQDENEVEIYPERDKIAVSIFDDDMGRTIYELYMVYGGLLRGAAYMDVVITDDATGEVIYRDTLENVRKSYAAGGSNVGSPIMLELKPAEWGLQNNSTYSVHIEGKLDYEGGENPARNSFDFPFTVDFEAPEMLAYRIRYMSYTENKVLKYRIFMDIDVRDNQYVQAILPCYVTQRPDGLGGTENVLNLLTEYPIPVTGQKGETSTVTFEVTDIFEEYVMKGKLRIEVEDYAMNSTNYIILPGQFHGTDAMGDPESVTFVEDEYLSKNANPSVDENGNEYYTYTLNITPNTMYKFKTVTEPENVIMKSLTWLNNSARVQAQGDELFAGAGGKSTLKLVNTTTDETKQRTYAAVSVLISGVSGPTPVLNGIKLNAVLNDEGIITSLDSTTSVPELELNPNQEVQLNWNWTPWYCQQPVVHWETSNDKVAVVDENGVITAIQRGTAYITVTAETAPGNPKVSKSVKVIVGREYRISNYRLIEYYGTGDIEIPSNLNIMYLDEDCFKGNTSITKVILPSSLTEIPENAFMGCTALKEIVIPGQCTVILNNAFAGCTALETVTLGNFVDAERNEIVNDKGENYAGTLTVGPYAFYNCTSLKNIVDDKGAPSKRLTTLGTSAFENCTSLQSIDLTGLRVVFKEAFKGCTQLANVAITKDTALSVGMFNGCTALSTFTFKGSAVPSNFFNGCTGLTSVTFENEITSIGSGAFENTAKLTNVTLPSGNITVSVDAFKNSGLTTLTLSAGTKLSFESKTPFAGCTSFTAYAINGNNADYSVDDGVLYNKDKTELVAVPYAKTSFTMPATVNSVANGSLSGVAVASIDLSAVANIGKYAFAGNTVITSVKLPDGLTEIPAGLFDGCTKLAEVTADDNFANVVKIGDNAFRGCGALKTIDMPNVTVVGASAFEKSGLTAVPSAKITKLGASAFEGSALVNVTLEALTEVGMRAFANISTLKTVALGAIAKGKMGSGLFVGSHQLNRVSFAEGTEEIGYGAFASLEAKVTTPLTVVLPSTVTYINQYAFYNQAGLTTIDLSHVLYVDEFAFCFSGLSNADLSNLKEIGQAAFAATYLTSANLESAEFVAAEAFYYTETLVTVTFGSLKRIGSDAFFGTSITSVTLPDTFNDRTYTYKWETYDEKGNFEEDWAREELNYGVGAFNGAMKLREIKANNNTFFDIDGVLYSRVANGLVLEQYPAAKSGEDYKVVDGTVIIQDNSFMYTNVLKNIELPYTVKVIGSNAFFGSTVENYTFNSVEAPVLRTSVFTSYDVTLDVLQLAFDRSSEGLVLTNFYANFKTFALLVALPDMGVFIESYNEELREKYGDTGLSMTIPRNATGYVGAWKLFFGNHISYTADIMPDDTTHKAIEAINALPSADAIKTMTLDEVKTTGSTGKLAVAARTAYNKITVPEQRALVTEELGRLLAVEKALRDRKGELGQSVNISSLIVTSRPKTRYNEGETFDPTGMVLTAVYDDGSEFELGDSNYEVSPTLMVKGTDKVVITYRDGDKSISTTILVQVDVIDNGEPSEPSNPITEDPGKLSKGAVIGLAVGIPVGVIVIAGVVVVVLIMLKKKKASGVSSENNENNSNNDNNQNNDIVNNDNNDNGASVSGEDFTDTVAEQNKDESNSEENVQEQSDAEITAEDLKAEDGNSENGDNDNE